ncbi:HEXXH motif domain-containing protein [Nonomuraea sp. NN258]|uniref:HEXXH motif domain-containing protein n=1 Tax=Nonomuraea antri TaxID=2730852 RepID=UPI001568C6B3|nr:HEXXH motif domain-containing protein [Nonomuraea antri]NRQ33604.1 HEXXH motif domain-containing protein [Nonomuraea antri]
MRQGHGHDPGDGMNIQRHRISDSSLAALAAPAAGGESLRAVGELCAAQESKHRLLVRLVVAEAAARGHPHAKLAERAYDVLARIEADAPEPVARCLRHPAVGAWALRTCRGQGDPGRLAAVALAAAVRAGVACRLDVPVSGGELVLPGLGRLLPPTGTPEVVSVAVVPAGESGLLDVAGLGIDPRRDEPGWQALSHVPLAPGFTVTIDDLDPCRWPGDDTEDRLDADRRQRWTDCLRAAWRLLSERHPGVAAELATVLATLVPVVARTHDQHSASSRETFGAIAVSDPVGGLDLALILAHELQHAKLNALSEVVDLIAPDSGRRYYAPWRPDPRPLFGLLHGAYAHAAVAGFWREHLADAELAPRAQAEFARWRAAAHEVTGTLLDSGELTEAGTRFVTGLRHTLGGWLAEPVPPAAEALARRWSERHREAWAAERG